MKRYSFYFTFTPRLMQLTTQQLFTMFINLILQSTFLFSMTGSWDMFAITSAVVFGLVFFQVNGGVATRIDLNAN